MSGGVEDGTGDAPVDRFLREMAGMRSIAAPVVAAEPVFAATPAAAAAAASRIRTAAESSRSRYAAAARRPPCSPSKSPANPNGLRAHAVGGGGTALGGATVIAAAVTPDLSCRSMGSTGEDVKGALGGASAAVASAAGCTADGNVDGLGVRG